MYNISSVGWQNLVSQFFEILSFLHNFVPNGLLHNLINPWNASCLGFFTNTLKLNLVILTPFEAALTKPRNLRYVVPSYYALTIFTHNTSYLNTNFEKLHVMQDYV